jgi:hypothetical protein
MMAPQLRAQTIDPTNMPRVVAQAQREQILSNNMGLGKKKMQKFWTVYELYRGEMIHQADRYQELIQDYSASYEKISQKEAARLLEVFLDIQAMRVEIKHKYLPLFNKVLKPKEVLRFYQIDNKLDSVVFADLAAKIPLVQ